MDYEDFVIQLGVDAGGATVRVASSPAGESDPEPLPLPVTAREVATLSAALVREAEVAWRNRDLIRVQNPPVSIPGIGERLFRSLFPEGIRNLYQQSFGRTAERGRGLRIRIELGLGMEGLSPLHAIPWEYLSDDGHYLCLSREISIVRHLALALPRERPPVKPPLSILLLAGEELEATELDLEEERKEIADAAGAEAEIRVRLLPDCTLEGLREELLAHEHHVLHFMGHGGFSATDGEGMLAFRDREGHRIQVSGQELAEHLRDRHSLRLVFLNACRTAQADAVSPYSGVATALLRVGVPAVVAMQFPISDVAAVALSRAFYRRIARGDSVDAALAEGRMAVRRLSRDNFEWGTPVLFERMTNGQIVQPPRDLPTPAPVKTSPWKTIAVAVGVALALGLAGALMVPYFMIERDQSPVTVENRPEVAIYQGCVRDSETNEPIKGVQVVVLARMDVPAQQTDDRGNFKLRIPILAGSAGEIRLQLLREGYREHNERIDLADRLTVNPDILLVRERQPAADRKTTAALVGPSSNASPGGAPPKFQDRPSDVGHPRVFRETFDDNRNGWMLTNDSSGRIEIKDGRYYMYSETAHIAAKPILENPSADFTIECKVYRLGGYDGHFFGLVWGMIDLDNFFDLALTGGGQVAITRKEAGRFTDYVDNSVPRDFVNLGEEGNRLKVEKSGNQIEFFVNGHSFYKGRAEPLFGPYIGFVVYSKVPVAFDDLVVTIR